MIDNLKLKARAIVAVRKRKAKQEQERLEVERATQASEDALIERLLSTLTLPTPKDGKDGRDAPTLSDILGAIELPEAKIVHTEKTIVQEVNPTTKEGLKLEMEDFIRGLLPEIQPEDRPAVEQLVPEVDLTGLVTHEEMKEHLKRIQRAISASQSGGTAVNPQIQENAEEILELSEALNNLITTLSAQGLTTQDILRSIETVAHHSQEELKLLNARTEEAFDTKLDEKDIT